jgi:Fe2+ or Zn2+ uptake regulation protein
VQYLNEVLDACQNAGLKVIATVYEMGVNNVQGLETGGCFQKENRVHNQEIAIGHDPHHHHLKCTHN